MHPRLERYAARAFSSLHGHWLIAEGGFEFIQPGEHTLVISGQAMGIDGSPLHVTERIKVEPEELKKIRYSYQFRHEALQAFSAMTTPRTDGLSRIITSTSKENRSSPPPAHQPCSSSCARWKRP